MAVLKELQADLREQGHGEHVVDGVLGKLMPFSCAWRFTSASSCASSGFSRSAGRQVMASAPSSTRACNAAFTGTGVWPYSPFRMPAVSFAMVCSARRSGR
jgi:hypothetical protein